MAEYRRTTEPARRAYGLLHVGAYPMIGSKFGPLMEIAGAAELPITEVLGVFHDDPAEVPVADLRSHACVCLAPGASAPEGLELDAVEIPGGDYAVATYKGPYTGLPAAWNQFLVKAIADGVIPGSMPCFEIYLNDCSKFPDSELLTDLYLKVE